MARSLFEVERERIVPTELARGPWDPGALHGGPVAALLARAAEMVLPADGIARQATRLTAELLRPVPLAPLAVTSEVVRPGRKVTLVEASVHAGGATVARAVVLFIRTAEVPVPDGHQRAAPPPPPERAHPTQPWAPDEQAAFHNAGVEHAFVAGNLADLGPATDWIRLRVPVLPGEDPSPFQRAVAAADFGNGISRVFERGGHVFINPDLTVHLHRLPVGEWVALEATTHVEGHGIGLAESALYDTQGRIGRAAQSLLIDVTG
ncbi:thioesterase family protein [soil metagenome]